MIICSANEYADTLQCNVMSDSSMNDLSSVAPLFLLKIRNYPFFILFFLVIHYIFPFRIYLSVSQPVLLNSY